LPRWYPLLSALENDTGAIDQDVQRWLTVVRSGAEIVRSINVRTDVIKPSACRDGSLNAVRIIRLVWTDFEIKSVRTLSSWSRSWWWGRV
jgi:hypothetical protein